MPTLASLHRCVSLCASVYCEFSDLYHFFSFRKGKDFAQISLIQTRHSSSYLCSFQQNKALPEFQCLSVWVFIDTYMFPLWYAIRNIRTKSVSAGTICRSVTAHTHSLSLLIEMKCEIFSSVYEICIFNRNEPLLKNTQHLMPCDAKPSRVRPSQKNRFRIAKHIFKHWSQSTYKNKRFFSLHYCASFSFMALQFSQHHDAHTHSLARSIHL